MVKHGDGSMMLRGRFSFEPDVRMVQFNPRLKVHRKSAANA